MSERIRVFDLASSLQRSHPASTMSSPAPIPIPRGSYEKIEDPEARWERIRSTWLQPSTSCSRPTRTTASPNDGQGVPARDNISTSVFQQRIQTLEVMLRNANAPSASASGSHATLSNLAGTTAQVPSLVPTEDVVNSKGKEKATTATNAGEDELPDDGFAVGGEKRGGSVVHELRRVSEGIFLAFKQGRALKEPLPLSLVTSLLYRGWLLDGTIPPMYDRALAEPDPPMPVPIASTCTTEAPIPRPEPTTPAQVLTKIMNSNAVTPLPSGDDPTTPGLSATDQGDLQTGIESDAGIANQSVPGTKPGIEPLQARDPTGGGSQASLEGMGADESSGKLKLDVLRGSRWRTEREIASGSDII
ncbi:uncharacterized protein JCM15063_005756 [Sporobolomyces koalae]|uniref:uncharacterized protein n=1 Tax=Sporobolomyces koalae TaxID=500713 RepID=UPI0031825B18